MTAWTERDPIPAGTRIRTPGGHFGTVVKYLASRGAPMVSLRMDDGQASWAYEREVQVLPPGYEGVRSDQRDRRRYS